MKALLPLRAFVLLSGAAVAASAAGTQEPGYPPYVVDKKLHATNDLRGKKAPKLKVAEWLSSHAPHTKGKVILMDFWATWCPDCHRLIPELNKFKQKFGDDLVIIGITDEPENVVKKFLEKNPIDSHIALAPDKKMYNAVGVKGIPQVLVISADGIVRFQGYADSKEDPLTEDKLAQIIKTSKAAKRNNYTRSQLEGSLLRLAVEPTALALRLVGYKPYDGLYYGWKFRRYADKASGHKNIEQLSMPYAAVVTDVVTGQSCRLTKGDLGLAMDASTAVPELRKPVIIENRLYCDGGLINNVPVNHVREMGADFVISVNIDEHLKEVPIRSFRTLGSMPRQALRIQLDTFDKTSCEKADVSIHPDTTGISLVSFHKADGKRGIDAGVAAARQAMPEIKKKLAALGYTSVSSVASETK